jgi:hypothetical protein
MVGTQAMASSTLPSAFVAWNQGTNPRHRLARQTPRTGRSGDGGVDQFEGAALVGGGLGQHGHASPKAKASCAAKAAEYAIEHGNEGRQLSGGRVP